MFMIIGRRNTYETGKILNEVKKMSLNCSFLEWSEITLPYTFRDIDLILIRSPPSMKWKEMSIYLLNFIEEMERSGIKVIPSSNSLRLCDKFSQFSIVSRYYPSLTPETLLTSDLNEAYNFLEKNINIVSKPLIGGGGRDIILINSSNKSLLKEVLTHNGYILLQRYIDNLGYDIRTIVIGDKVISQYARKNDNDFRYNIKLGAHAYSPEEFSKISPESVKYFLKAKEYSLKISEILGLEMFGTDFLPGQNGNLYFLEANPFFGFKGAKENVANKILEFINEKTKNL
ncbi:MAG: ATP-grasp domain-containing protein [Candidatus Odinarchaeia archaeon]